MNQMNQLLVDLVDNSYTDKNTSHSYLPTYDKLLIGRKNKAQNVLEVGVGPGGSIKLWHDYFTHATIYGVDIKDRFSGTPVASKIKNNERIKLYLKDDAYDNTFITEHFIDKGITFDFILDDGAHTLESQIDFISLYSDLLTDDGILIIEDVQTPKWFQILETQTPAPLQSFIKTYDLRKERLRKNSPKGPDGTFAQGDNLIFVIDKSCN